MLYASARLIGRPGGGGHQTQLWNWNSRGKGMGIAMESAELEKVTTSGLERASRGCRGSSTTVCRTTMTRAAQCESLPAQPQLTAAPRLGREGITGRAPWCRITSQAGLSLFCRFPFASDYSRLRDGTCLYMGSIHYLENSRIPSCSLSPLPPLT